MTRFRLVFTGLAIVLAVVALVWTATQEREDGTGSANGTAAHAARVAAQVGMRSNTTTVPVDVPNVHVPAPKPAPVYATQVERAFAASGASPAEIDVMKQSWPDWETRFGGASDDMVKAHLARVKPLVPVTIPNEVSRVAAVDVDAVVARSLSVGDDVSHVGAGASAARGGADVLDDVARGGAGVLDDVARGGAGVFDDLLRVLGLGGAAAGAAAAAASQRKK